MLKILNTILFVACENSDGLMGFYYSHDGGWYGRNEKYEGYITKIECANTCMGREGCVGISTHATTSNGQCWHYVDRADLVSSNEDNDPGQLGTAKAYIKCFCTDV